MGEVYIGLCFDLGEVDCGVIVVAGDAVSGISAVWVEGACDLGVDSFFSEVVSDAGGGIVDLGFDAREEEELLVGDLPEFAVFCNEVDACAGTCEVADEVLADEFHNFPNRFARQV